MIMAQTPQATEEKFDIDIDDETMLQAQANLARQGVTISDYIQIMVTKAAMGSVKITKK